VIYLARKSFFFNDTWLVLLQLAKSKEITNLEFKIQKEDKIRPVT
jgi:hypothetical protein